MFGRILSIALALGFVLLTALSVADARPPKGFLEGPYLTLEIGAMQLDRDTDQVTGQDVGDEFEPAIGFLFGWNVRDPLSIELQGRYTTVKHNTRRAHYAHANVYGKFHFIADPLVDFPTLRILPFLKAGLGVRISALPGALTSSRNTVAQVGWGPSVGGGIAFLWHKYFYFGIDVQEDFLFQDDINQEVGGVPGTLVYKGGFAPSFGAMAILGVHY